MKNLLEFKIERELRTSYIVAAKTLLIIEIRIFEFAQGIRISKFVYPNFELRMSSANSYMRIRDVEIRKYKKQKG